MKKFIMILAVASLAACSKTETGTGTANTTLNQRTISVSEWLYNDSSSAPANAQVNGSYFFHSEHMADFITTDVYSKGDVSVFLYVGNTQSELPYTRHYRNVETNEIYTTTIDFVYESGYLHIYYTQNNFPTNPTPPGTLSFRVVTEV